jgi:hypothetical protein
MTRAVEGSAGATQCRIVPFVPGRRPQNEAAHPGLGSSEDIAVLLPDGEEDLAYLLYDVTGDLTVRARVSVTGPDGSLATEPVPGWEDREVAPLTFVPGSHGSPWLAAIDSAARRRVLPIDPRDLLDGTDPCTFDHLFCQRLRVAGDRGGRARPGPGLPPVVPGARDRGGQGGAVHAGAGARHRRRRPAPVGPGLAHARRALPRVPHVPRDLRGGEGRRGRPPVPRGARRVRAARVVRRDPRVDRPARLAHGVGPAPDPVPAARDASHRARRGAQPAGQEAGDAALPARPPRRPQARDPPRRAQSPQRPGDVAAGVPRRRAGGAAQRRRRVPGARRRHARRPRLHPLAPPRPLRDRPHGARAGSGEPAVRRPGRPVRLRLHAVPRLDERRRRVGQPRSAG